jgi:LacI family transcriptional regulator
MEDDLSYIEVDHEAGSRLAVRHLVERGYKRIAFVGGQETSPSNQIRLLAYQQTLQESGLQVESDLISYGGFGIESGYNRLAALMRLQNPPDAVFCGNDIIALGALHYARDNGIEVPKQLALIGFDDISYASLPQIGLSTVSQPRTKLGEQAFEALMREIEIFPARSRQRLLVEPELIARSTT